MTAIVYSNAAPFAVETAPTSPVPCPFVGAVLTAIFDSSAAPFAVVTAPTGPALSLWERS